MTLRLVRTLDDKLLEIVAERVKRIKQGTVAS